MNSSAYKAVKRRFAVARQRALGSMDPVLWREYEKAKAERDRAYFMLRGGFALAS
jgi:hypothetical protein